MTDNNTNKDSKGNEKDTNVYGDKVGSNVEQADILTDVWKDSEGKDKKIITNIITERKNK